MSIYKNKTIVKIWLSHGLTAGKYFDSYSEKIWNFSHEILDQGHNTIDTFISIYTYIYIYTLCPFEIVGL